MVAVVDWEMDPDVFFNMSPNEFFLIYDRRKPPEMVGKMRKDTFDNLVEMLENAKSR